MGLIFSQFLFVREAGAVGMHYYDIDITYDPNSGTFSSYTVGTTATLCPSININDFRYFDFAVSNSSNSLTTLFGSNASKITNYATVINGSASYNGQRIARGVTPSIYSRGTLTATLEFPKTVSGNIFSWTDDLPWALTQKIQVSQIVAVCWGKNGAADYNFLRIRLNPFTLTSPVNIKTCTITSDVNQIINMNSITRAKLISDGEVFGRSFTISTNCGSSSAVKSAYVVFTDGNNSSNTTNVLTTTSGDGYAQGVGLKIYPSGSSTAITYNPEGLTKWVLAESAGYKMSNFQSGSGSQTFDVYYAKTGDTVTAGNVEGLAIYNLFYQ
ncbi:hypothetical protein A6A20_03635 [Volucribacter amazonae]|uniref:Fimbrial-type adhesion domain-containing protein n=2 Tax=Volucribacter amazonae TaxID=256731 RepID=A0A9X4SL62_9PAST|nr:hypothetical protein [Volucribacter amazonae]